MANPTNDDIVTLASRQVTVRHKPHCHKQCRTEARVALNRTGSLTVIMYCEKCGIIPVIEL